MLDDNVNNDDDNTGPRQRDSTASLPTKKETLNYLCREFFGVLFEPGSRDVKFKLSLSFKLKFFLLSG